jgi:hypothetical protein
MDAPGDISELKRAGVTYEDMSNRLKKHALDETRDSMAAKLKRGTFGATFLLACFEPLDSKGIRSEDICSLGRARYF